MKRVTSDLLALPLASPHVGAMPDPTERLNAALEGRYRIKRELDEGGMAIGVPGRTPPPFPTLGVCTALSMKRTL